MKQVTTRDQRRTNSHSDGFWRRHCLDVGAAVHPEKDGSNNQTFHGYSAPPLFSPPAHPPRPEDAFRRLYFLTGTPRANVVPVTIRPRAPTKEPGRAAE